MLLDTITVPVFFYGVWGIALLTDFHRYEYITLACQASRLLHQNKAEFILLHHHVCTQMQTYQPRCRAER